MNHVVRVALYALISSLFSFSAYAGPFTDVPVDLSVPGGWASTFQGLVRGPIDSGDPNSTLASFGSGSLALGPATGVAGDIVSLGNGGTITLGFDGNISDGPGPDFAIFENGFSFDGDVFGELAFVAVSTDGINFASFESTSLNAGPIGDFDPVDPTNVHNLAGQFVAGLGTGFDLSDLVGDPLALAGLLNLMDVNYVRLTDVVGDGSTVDSFGNMIFDPFPTAFASSGFDLEAVGVLNGTAVPEPSGLVPLALCTLLLGRRFRR